MIRFISFCCLLTSTVWNFLQSHSNYMILITRDSLSAKRYDYIFFLILWMWFRILSFACGLRVNPPPPLRVLRETEPLCKDGLWLRYTPCAVLLPATFVSISELSQKLWIISREYGLVGVWAYFRFSAYHSEGIKEAQQLSIQNRNALWGHCKSFSIYFHFVVWRIWEVYIIYLYLIFPINLEVVVSLYDRQLK
jgi:hypothetical protein